MILVEGSTLKEIYREKLRGLEFSNFLKFGFFLNTLCNFDKYKLNHKKLNLQV